MDLLLDSDAFCKLGVADLLNETAALFGVDQSHYRRLPALPYMLQRGRLRKSLGDATADQLIPLAESFSALTPAAAIWLDKFTNVPAVDPGEAQILAVAAERQSIVITGDKAALRAVSALPGFAHSLAGRVALYEAILIALCDTLWCE